MAGRAEDRGPSTVSIWDPARAMKMQIRSERVFLGLACVSPWAVSKSFLEGKEQTVTWFPP